MDRVDDADEQKLWMDARRGNRSSFARLFDIHAPALYRFASRLLGDGPDAEDCVHNVLLSVLDRNGFDPSLGSVRAYLFGAVRNQARKLRRATPEELTDCVQSSEIPPDCRLAIAEISQAVEAAIQKLPWIQRETLLLFHYEEFSLKEIADTLNLELAAVKSRLSRARESLRIQLQNYAPKEAGDRR